MAFKYFTIDSIKAIALSDIPQAFIEYYEGLKPELQQEIFDIRPDLVKAISPEAVVRTEETKKDDSIFSEPGRGDSESGNETAENEEEDSPIIDAWEDMSIRAWQRHEVETNVVVCKVIPNDVRTCKVHRIPFQEKQLKIKQGTSTYGIVGYLCPECMDFFVEQQKIGSIVIALEKRNIPAWIQPLEETISEWKERAVPIPFDEEDIVFIPDTWVEERMVCPLHEGEILIEDTYRKTYKNRFVDFEACYCGKCRKILMRNAKAQKLEEDCGKIGIPPISFKPLRRDAKSKVSPRTIYIRPDFFIQNGNISQYDYDEDVLWDKLTEEETAVITYSRSCTEEDHESEDVLALVDVQEKKGGRKHYLVLLGYCSECERYYLPKEDYDLLAAKGRPVITLIDETNTYDSITSGATFISERTHLEKIIGGLEDHITKIKSTPGFVGKFDTISGGYDDGSLSFAKSQCEPLYAEIDKTAGYLQKPYGYRTDIKLSGTSKVYYLGPDDIEIDGERQVISFNSNLGRKLVNYRTLDLAIDGAKWKVKRRRTFDIEKGILFGFTEQSDEDVIFRSGITDTFLVRVLNLRKKQHQLIDIISTIQENQNTIVDSPFKDNLIVQGCAGSGKTMVLLHRLSALKYNHPDFDFRNAVILTPSGYFNTHIGGLASNLQLGYVERFSVEDYYREVLQRYDPSFHITEKIADEMDVHQDYVDYFYSEDFWNLMLDAYTHVFSKVLDYYQQLVGIDVNSAWKPAVKEGMNDYEITQLLLRELEDISARFSEEDYKLKHLQSNFRQLIERYNFLKEELPESVTRLKNIVTEETAKVYVKLQDALQELLRTQEQLDIRISANTEEYRRIEGTVFVVRKAQKLGKIQASINETRDRKEQVERDIAKIRTLMTTDVSEMNAAQVMIFFDVLLSYNVDTAPNKRSIRRQQETVEAYQKEWNSIPDTRKRMEREIEAIVATRASSEKKGQIAEIYQNVKDMTPKAIYDQVYQEAALKADAIIQEKTGKSYIAEIKGTHRYDLYLQLRFALRYFGKALGENTLICIDEGQDVAVEEYRLIRDINAGKAILNIYGDTNQLLKYRRGISEWHQVDGIISEPQMYTLNENYRNTNQITRFCNETFNMDVTLTGVDGLKVKEILRSKLESTLAISKINEERIAIIVPRKVSKDTYLDEDQLPENILSRIGETIGNGQIAITYVDEIKGVEFDRVYVVPNSMTKNEKYIAFTRALSELILVIDDSLDESVPGSQISQAQGGNTETGTSGGQEIKASGSVRIGKVRKKKKNKKTKIPGEGVNSASDSGNKVQAADVDKDAGRAEPKKDNETDEPTTKYVKSSVNNLQMSFDLAEDGEISYGGEQVYDQMTLDFDRMG